MGRSWVITWKGVVRRPSLVSDGYLEAEQDGVPVPVNAVADLRAEGPDRLGGFFAWLIGGSGHRLPPTHIGEAVITDDGGTLIARSPNGMRGGLNETGFLAEPLTPDSWARTRRL